jgi:hypothetical protein
MSRSKELRRIEAAIEHPSLVELKWAEEYCRMRLSYTGDSPRNKLWPRTLERVQAAIRDLNGRTA